MPDSRTYLGDGVYAEFDGFQVWVYTSNGVEESRKIALEPATLAALNKFDADMRRGANVEGGSKAKYPAYGPGSITDAATYETQDEWAKRHLTKRGQST